MKTLALLRHAKSSWDDPALADFDRPLNHRGRKAAERMGEEMRRRGLVFDLVLASPAKRIVETIEHLEKGYRDALRLRLEPGIYEASAGGLLQLVRGVEASVERLLLIGHNPALQETAISLAAPADPLYPQIVEKYPTAALAMFDLPADRWSEAGYGSATVTAFLRPRDLDDR